MLYNNGKWERLDLIASTETLPSEEGPRDLCKTPLSTQAPGGVGRPGPGNQKNTAAKIVKSRFLNFLPQNLNKQKTAPCVINSM